jgi:GTP-binding protein Era
MARFTDFFSISARKGRGVERVLARIESLLPLGPHFYPPHQLTEHPERFFVGELIREAVFDLYRQELPYSTEIEITAFREQPDGKDLITATVYVETPSQKGIVIGKGGSTIKRLGQRARDAIEAFLGRPVFLELRVRVMPDWRRDQRALRRFGY